MVPLLLASGIGSEARKSLATVAGSNLIASTLLAFVVLLVTYDRIAKHAEGRRDTFQGRGTQRAAEVKAAR